MTTTELPIDKIVHDTHSAVNGREPGPRRSPATEIKIAYIGGGSRSWAIGLMCDLALSGTLTGTLALYDIDHAAAEHNVQLSSEIFSHPEANSSFHVRTERKLADALRGADFVVISIEPGPTGLRYADLEIPAKYGVLQTVGDTTGPGGLVRALRSVPLFREFARAIMEHCPKAWVINYTNPMALCTATLYAEAPGIKAFGCCHEVFGTQKLLAKLVADWFEVDQPEREEIHLEIAGVNHFTWATGARWKEHDLMPRLREHIQAPDFFRSRKEEADAAKARRAWFDSEKLIAFDLLRRFGALGAAGDRHLVEFMPGYLSSEAELHRWGVVITPYSWRMERMKAPLKPLGTYVGQPLKPTGEEGVQQIEALLGLRHLVTNVNLPNAGQMADLPRGLIVETYADFQQNGIRPVLGAALPPGAASHVRRAADEQALTLAAALGQDLQLAYQALVSHPLVQHLPPDTAWEMLQEMIQSIGEHFPESGLLEYR